MDWIDEILLFLWDILEALRSDPPNRGPPKKDRDGWEHVQ